MSSHVKGYIALFTTSTVWGATWVLSKMAIKEVPALQLAATRQLIAGSLLVGFYLITGKQRLPSRTQFVWLFFMSVLMFVMANGLSTLGITYIPSGLGALIGTMYPLSVVVMQYLFFNQRHFDKTTYLGLFLGIAGIVLVFYESAFSFPHPLFAFGIVLSLVAMLSWSLGSILLNRNKTNINPYYGTGWQMLLAGLMISAYNHIAGVRIPLASISAHGWFLILVLAIVGSIIAFMAFIYSMKVLQPSIASLYAYINPIVTILLAAVLIPEPITFKVIWGALVTLLGVYLVNYSVRRKQAMAEPEM